MSLYCITAAKHENPDNHLASMFKLWKYNEEKKVWKCLDWKDAFFIVALLQDSQNTVLTAKHDEKEKEITFGAPIEFELRIAKKEKKYKISDMPSA